MTRGWHPMRDLVTLQDRMNRLFEEAAEQRGTRGEEETQAQMERADWHPAADVFETEREYVIALDLPGIQREALNVGLDDNQLVISGERAPMPEGVQQRRAERPAGRFVRSFILPQVVDREGITADYKDGVLHLRLPKRSEQQSRRVEIKIQ